MLSVGCPFLRAVFPLNAPTPTSSSTHNWWPVRIAGAFSILKSGFKSDSFKPRRLAKTSAFPVHVNPFTMATVVWQPRQDGVDQIVSLLTQYQQASVDHAQIFAQLQHCSSFPDFNNYLVFIFSSGESYSVEVRQSAGLLLKNNLKTAFLTTAPEFQTFIKHHVLRSLGTDNPNIRSTTGTIIRYSALCMPFCGILIMVAHEVCLFPPTRQRVGKQSYDRYTCPDDLFDRISQTYEYLTF